MKDDNLLRNKSMFLTGWRNDYFSDVSTDSCPIPVLPDLTGRYHTLRYNRQKSLSVFANEMLSLSGGTSIFPVLKSTYKYVLFYIFPGLICSHQFSLEEIIIQTRHV